MNARFKVTTVRFNFVGTVPGIDSTLDRTFGEDFRQERGTTPCDTRSVFHDLLKRIPRASFDRLVDSHAADKHVRQLSTKNQFVALCIGRCSTTQEAAAESLD